MFSELRSNGPRLPAGKIDLAAAIERVGELTVKDWVGIKRIYVPDGPAVGRHMVLEPLGAEREAAALADEGHAVANVFEPAPEPEPSPADAVCSTCRKPATRIRAGHPYCDRHGKRLPVPPEIRKLIAKTAGAAARGAPDNDVNEGAGEDDRPAPDQAALFRWAEASAAARDKVYAGEVRAWLREPGGKISPMTAAEWREDGFPAPDEAMARLPSRGHVPMHVIFDVADLDRAFSAAPQTEGQSAEPLSRASPGRPGMAHLIHQEMERRAKAGELCPILADEARDLAKWARSNCGERQPPGAKTITKEHAAFYRELKSRAS